MNWLPDAHPEPYLWLSVFGSHLAIGVALWLLFSETGERRAVVLTAFAYGLWEAFSALRWGLLWWDSVLDTVGVTLGALVALMILYDERRLAGMAAGAAVAIGLIGVLQRS